MAQELVELHHAWMWDCPECGRENFCRSIKADLTREESIELARELGDIDEFSEIPDDHELNFYTQPHEVECDNCHCKFMNDESPDENGDARLHSTENDS